MNQETHNLQGLAIDKWLSLIPDDPYSPCPCGCGKKFKFVIGEIDKHEEKFVNEFINKYSN
jgi:hypothetical protein